MARPEGYRKAVRLMEMADRFGLPVLSIVDPAAIPVSARKSATGRSDRALTDACLSLGVPCGDRHRRGHVGGAIAITTANKVLMFEHAITA
jgi:acetyl-CoA carboxylase carboxyl transferase subunit alpha